MRAALPRASERRVCRALEVARSSLRPAPWSERLRRPLERVLVERVRELIKRHPTFGYRKLWALLRFGDGLLVNLKAVYRILAAKRWFVHQRSATPRPRVQGRRNVAPASDLRWAIDLRHVSSGQDGWGHLAAFIDCHDREIVACEFALRGRAREAERALECAWLRRFGTAPRGCDADCEERQRTDSHGPALQRRLPRLPPSSGVHRALHAGAERHDRALLLLARGGGRLAAQLRFVCRGTVGDRGLDPLVQRASYP